MKWGLITNSAENAVHVMPCDETGRVLVGHEVDVRCACRPTPLKEANWVMTRWSHHDGQ